MKKIKSIFINRVHLEQSGQIMALVLVLLILGIALVIPTLNYNATTLKITREDKARESRLYAADAGIKNAFWELKYGDGSDIPEYTGGHSELGPYSLNGEPIYVSLDCVDYNSLTNMNRYKITSTAGDDKKTTVESYASCMPDIFKYAVTSKDVNLYGSTDLKYYPDDGTEPPVNTLDPSVTWDTSKIASFYLNQAMDGPNPADFDTDYEVSAGEYVINTDTVPAGFEMGPLYVEGNLTLTGAGTVTITGAVYVTGKIVIDSGAINLVLGENGALFSADETTTSNEGNRNDRAILIGSNTYVSGNGPIIAVGDVYYEPHQIVGDGSFILVMSIEHNVILKPQGQFYGTVFGIVKVDVQNGNINLSQPTTGINFPSADFTGSVWSLSDWQLVPSAYQWFKVTASSSTVNSGDTVDITVTAMDQSDESGEHINTDYTGTIVFSCSDDDVDNLPGTYTFDGTTGTDTFTGIILNTGGSQYIEVYDTADTSITGAVSINVLTTASSLVFTNSSLTISADYTGESATNQMTVEVQDSNGDPVDPTSITSSITVGLTSTSSAGLFDTDNDGNFDDTSLTISAGTNSNYFYYRDTTAGNPIITASDISTPSTLSSDTDTETVTAGAPTKLAFDVQPSNVEVKTAISPAVTVEVQDQHGNLVTSATTSITITLGTNPYGGKLTGSSTTTVSAILGVATFSKLEIDTSGDGYYLLANGTYTQATSSTFNVGGVNITNFTPNIAGNDNSSLTMTITGTGFVSGATVKLTRGTGSVTGTVSALSTTEITCTFNLTTAISGKWYVVVTNTNGQSDTSDGFFKLLAVATDIPDNTPSGSTKIYTGFDDFPDLTGSTINGVTVTLTVNTKNSKQDYNVSLSINGGTTYPSSETGTLKNVAVGVTSTVGSVSDIWGISWTPVSIVNSIWVRTIDTTYLDVTKVSVYYYTSD